MDAPAIAGAGDGKKFAVAWMDMRSGRNDRQVYWMLLPGATSEKPLADDPKGIKGHPSIATGAGGIHSAWEDDRSGVQRIRYRSPEGKDVAISPEKGKATFPSLACGKVVGIAFEYASDAVFAAAVK
jgi:hypothetical protein